MIASEKGVSGSLATGRDALLWALGKVDATITAGRDAAVTGGAALSVTGLTGVLGTYVSGRGKGDCAKKLGGGGQRT